MKNKNVIHIVLNNFTHDSRVLKEITSLSDHIPSANIVLLALWDSGLQKAEKLAKNLAVHRIRIASRERINIRQIRGAFTLTECFIKFVLKTVKARPSIIHCHDLNALCLGVAASLLCKTKVIYDAHEWETDCTPGQSKKRRALLRFVEKIAIKRADEIITVNDSIADEYNAVYGVKRPHVIVNAPHESVVKKTDHLRKYKNLPNSTKIYLYQGALTYGRGIELILKYFSDQDVSKRAVFFMGYGPLSETIEQYAKDSSAIFLHPAVPYNQILDYTSSADFGICIGEKICRSYELGLPNKLFEYLHAGLPILCSSNPEFIRIVQKFLVGTIFDANSADGLKIAIERIEREDYHQMQLAARLFKNEYSWQTQQKTLLSIYKSLST